MGVLCFNIYVLLQILVLERPRTRRIRRVRIIWVMSATGQRSKFSLLAPLSLLLREEEWTAGDDISWNNTAIVDSIPFLLLIFLSQILPIWILLRYDDTGLDAYSRKKGKNSYAWRRRRNLKEILCFFSPPSIKNPFEKKLRNNFSLFDQPPSFNSVLKAYKKKANIFLKVKLLKEGNSFFESNRLSSPLVFFAYTSNTA